MKVLIAEDESLVARQLEQTVRGLGHQVVGTAGTGRRAVELARTLEPDLVLLDIGLPDMDGIAAAQEILGIRAVPIIIVTGRPDPDLVERAAFAGVFTYLLKPVTRRDLDAAIRTAWARFAELQALHRQVRDLTEALEIRKVVEQAKGILMDRLQVSEAEAFRRLQRYASVQRRPMGEVAKAVQEADRFYRELETEER